MTTSPSRGFGHDDSGLPSSPGRPGDASATGAPRPDGATLRLALGGLLVLLGASAIVTRLVPAVAEVTWPLTLIVIGLTIVLAGARR